MLILSLECAGGGCGACVMKDDVVLALAEESMARGQDARLMPLVQEVMARAGVDYAELDRVAVTRGPGSFTGLRIGLAAARGIGLAAAKPVLGIDRFALFRAQHSAQALLLVVLESRRLELYAQLAGDEAKLLPPDEIRALVAHGKLAVAGDAAQTLPGLSFLPKVEAESVTAARLAAKADLGDPAYAPRPLYLRAPDVTIKACEGVS